MQLTSISQLCYSFTHIAPVCPWQPPAQLCQLHPPAGKAKQKQHNSTGSAVFPHQRAPLKLSPEKRLMAVNLLSKLSLITLYIRCYRDWDFYATGMMHPATEPHLGSERGQRLLLLLDP
jgi:hypothetical protein